MTPVALDVTITLSTRALEHFMRFRRLSVLLSAKVLFKQELRTASIVTFSTVKCWFSAIRQILVEQHILLMLKKYAGERAEMELFSRPYIERLQHICVLQKRHLHGLGKNPIYTLVVSGRGRGLVHPLRWLIRVQRQQSCDKDFL